MKRTGWCLLLLAGILASSCGEAASVSKETEAAVPHQTEAVTETETAVDPETLHGLAPADYQGAEFRIAAYENPNYHADIVIASETGDTLDDALFRRNRNVEEACNIKLMQQYEVESAMRSMVLAGDGTYDYMVLTCPSALTWWKDGLLIPADELPHIDLSKKYWDSSINTSLSLGGTHYVANGAFNLDIYDLTFCLLFSKSLAAQYDFNSFYETVSDGKWTFDAMKSAMMTVTGDVNGDSVMDENDRWGYSAHPKMVAPGFWIGADVLSVTKNASDMPEIGMTDPRFVNAFERVFDVVWDSNSSYLVEDPADIPEMSRQMFADSRCLFIDMSFFYIARMRDVDMEFGILPYPKYDEEQDSYHCRVCYYFPTIVPVSCTDLDRAGYVMELLQYESLKTVLPSYYDVALKTKYSRDDDSAAMLDLIFSCRRIDIGDSSLCSTIRDNFIFTMMKKNDRTLVSTVEKRRKSIEKELAFLSD